MTNQPTDNEWIDELEMNLLGYELDERDLVKWKRFVDYIRNLPKPTEVVAPVEPINQDWDKKRHDGDVIRQGKERFILSPYEGWCNGGEYKKSTPINQERLRDERHICGSIQENSNKCDICGKEPLQSGDEKIEEEVEITKGDNRKICKCKYKGITYCDVYCSQCGRKIKRVE